MSRSVNIRIRPAKRADLVRKVVGGEVLLQGKDFWVEESDGSLGYYRLNRNNPEVMRMIKEGLPAQRIFVVDVEGMESDWVSDLVLHQSTEH